MDNKKIQGGWSLENSYSHLPEIFFTRKSPEPVSAPELIILNKQLAESLGLEYEELKNKDSVDIFAGNKIIEGSIPLAQAYAGHQFGHFNMLGDGRAILLGEQITPWGERFDIALKGSGRTRYSRGGDGRAGLGPMLREYIISEAMHGLKIPTTRSLAVVTTGDPIIRETMQKGAILTRVAKSHIRVGSFQYASVFGNVMELKELADYTIQRHFPQINSDENKYISLLREVIKGQAGLIAKWQLVGFIHGVMNTDNMTISGETIDYGPCAFMDEYDPATVFSSIDTMGRYAYGNQPNIGGWNLSRFAESLLPLIHDDEKIAVDLVQNEISNFTKLYNENWISGMRAKLGIFNEEAEDRPMVYELLDIMKKYRADYTNTFVALTFNNLCDIKMFDSDEFKDWHKEWQSRLGRQEESKELSHELMKGNNPAVIPRNHRVEEALEAAANKADYSVMERLICAISKPYEHSEEQAIYASLPEESRGQYRTYCGT